MKTVTLYRPVGEKEFQLIKESGFKKFPPRLEWQPIFYPVLNQAYAEQIASEWNTNDEFSGFTGHVMAFDILEDYVNQFSVQNVGGEIHTELWIPAEELENFNHHIAGEIKLIRSFYGHAFKNKTNFPAVIRGALFGLATGDALGVPVEFKSRHILKNDPVTGMREYGSHNQPAGTWSDDSSLLFVFQSHSSMGTTSMILQQDFFHGMKIVT